MSSLAKMFTKRAFHWLFEFLPLCLLAFQSLAAMTSQGNVDGWSRNAVRGVGDFGRAAGGQLANFLGRWSIQERTNMDEFLEALGFAAWQRALITRAGQETTLEARCSSNGDELRIVTSDLRGTTQLELPLNGAEREACAAKPAPFACTHATERILWWQETASSSQHAGASQRVVHGQGRWGRRQASVPKREGRSQRGGRHGAISWG